jgi:hypothetical protein
MIAIVTAVLYSAVLAGVVGPALLLFKSKRRLGLRLLVGSIGVFVAFITVGPDLDAEARRQGFATFADLSKAKQAGITDPEVWMVKGPEIDAEAKRMAEERTGEAKRKSAELAREARHKIKRACVITGAGLEAPSSCARWENVQICRHQPADAFPDYLFYKMHPGPGGGCIKGIERWASENDIDPNWIGRISALAAGPIRCEFNQIPVRVRSMIKSSP